MIQTGQPMVGFLEKTLRLLGYRPHDCHPLVAHSRPATDPGTAVRGAGAMAAGNGSIVTLNVGGRKFSSSRDTVCKVRLCDGPMPAAGDTREAAPCCDASGGTWSTFSFG